MKNLVREINEEIMTDVNGYVSESLGVILKVASSILDDRTLRAEELAVFPYVCEEIEYRLSSSEGNGYYSFKTNWHTFVVMYYNGTHYVLKALPNSTPLQATVEVELKEYVFHTNMDTFIPSNSKKKEDFIREYIY